MPATPIVTDLASYKYVHPFPEVYIASKLEEAEFEVVPYLRAEMVQMAAAPQVDHAIITCDFGYISREDGAPKAKYSPQDLVGKFVKVKVPSTVPARGELPADPDNFWYGICEGNSRLYFGSGDDAATPSGSQQFDCFGVLRLLEKQPILSSFVETGDFDGDGNPVPLETLAGLPFGSDRGGAFPSRKNRGNSLFTPPESTTDEEKYYLFSGKARNDQDWDAYEAARYLLANHAPTDDAGNPVNVWRLKEDLDPGLINWYDVAVQTDGRTVKSVLDELMPRQRGVGYWAYFDPTDDTCRITVFTFVETDITLPSGATLKANPFLWSLEFEQAFDIEECNVSDYERGRYHRVIARGEKRTTTFTERLGGTSYMFAEGWTDDEKTAYCAGASGETWYAALDQKGKMLANAAARASDKFRNVFTRWALHRRPLSASGGQGPYLFISGTDNVNTSGDDVFYYLCPDLATEPLESAFNPSSGTFPDNYDGNPVWAPGVTFLRNLPLFDRYDYTGENIAGGEAAWKGSLTGRFEPEYLQPFAFARIAVGGTPEADRYIPLHRMHETAFDKTAGRTWSAGLDISSNDPSFRISAHPNHFVNLLSWNSAPDKAVTASDQDPNVHGGLPSTQIWVTLCAELDEYIRAECVIAAAPEGVPESVLVIPCPDCRADWVAPYTTVEIRSGQMAKSTSGGFVRDDRERLKDISRSAAEWYGRTRQSLQLTYKSLRPLFQVGMLITDFGSFQKTSVNTPVTSVTYEFGRDGSPGRTRIETSFADLEEF